MLSPLQLNALLSDFVRGACHARDPDLGHSRASLAASEALANLWRLENSPAVRAAALATAWLRQVWLQRGACVVDWSAQSQEVVSLLVREAGFSFDQALEVISSLDASSS
jgi:hypothetical protein